MVGEMNSAVSLVDFDRMLNGLDRIYSEFARTCGLSDCAPTGCSSTRVQRAEALP